MSDHIASIFATRHSNWADIQALLNMMLVTDKWQLVIDKANEEAHHLHQKNPNRTPNPGRGVILLIEPKWDPNGGDLASLDHY